MRKKIKYQGGITKALCMKIAHIHKKKFLNQIFDKDLQLQYSQDKLDFDVISFSGASIFEDQLLSIYSFVFYAGTPENWIIYSDKSYTNEQKAIFKDKFPFVDVIDWDVFNYRSNKYISDYLEVCPLAKKLNIITGHQYQRQTIYLDSDILFYENIKYYFDSALLNNGFWYAPDTMWGNNVANYFKNSPNFIYPLNSGMLILNEKFNIDFTFEYLESLKGNYQYFSEQSSFEYAFRKENANLLDPRQFIIDASDQFDFSTKYYPDEIAMRHYTGPVRHKMWQNGWRWHFNG